MKHLPARPVRSIVFPLWLATVTAISGITAVGVMSYSNAFAQAKKKANKKATAKKGDSKKAKAKVAPPRFLEFKQETTLARFGRRTIKRMLDGRDPLDPLFDEYFIKWFFPQLTQFENRKKLPVLRDQLQKYFQIAKRSETSTERLNQLTHDLLLGIAIGAQTAVLKDGRKVAVVRRIGRDGKRSRYWTWDHQEIPGSQIQKRERAKPDFDPTVRYNAMLLVAGLNSRPAVGDQPAEPWLDGLKDLLMVAKYDKLPQSIRVAALIGVSRHADVPDRDGAEAIKETIASAMHTIISQPVAGNQAPDGDTWIRRQAVDTLARLKIPGPANKNILALAKLVGDQQKPHELRTAAAGAIAAIDVQALGAEQAGSMTTDLINLAVDCCRSQASGGSSAGEMVAWQQLTLSIQNALHAMRTLNPVLPEEEKQIASQVEAALNRILMNGANQNNTPQDRLKLLTHGVTEVERIVSGEGTDEGEGGQPMQPQPMPVDPPPDLQF